MVKNSKIVGKKADKMSTIYEAHAHDNTVVKEKIVYETTEEAFPHIAGWCCGDEMIEIKKLHIDNGSILTLWKCYWCNGRDWSF